MRKYHHLKLWKLIGLFYLLLVSYFSLRMPSSNYGEGVLPDKILHTLTYLFAGIWFGLLIDRKYLTLVFIFLCAFGYSIELIQESTGYRYYEIEDQWANMAGAFLGCLLTLVPSLNLIKYLEKTLFKVK